VNTSIPSSATLDPRSAPRLCASNPHGGDRPDFEVRTRRLSGLQALSVGRERRRWNRRGSSWENTVAMALTPVVDAVLEECRRVPDAIAVDLGAGSGAVTIPLARTCSRILAVDVSDALLDRLRANAEREGVDNIDVINCPIQSLELAPASVDLIVTNYAMHHLSDAEKQAVLQRGHQWLRPGGRLIVGDMMFGRSLSAENRPILTAKAAIFLRRGPAGWLRLLKNLVRLALRTGERPLTPAAWSRLAARVGFESVTVRKVRSEAHLMVAIKADAVCVAGAGAALTPGSERS
jgi:2-polyprenyl-3-methyl-5-hydroxy-6-metoxy-1,4-benzoquinol methylase